MTVPDRLAALDRRRAVGRRRAMGWFLVGCTLTGAGAATGALALLAALARLVAAVTATPVADVALWGWSGSVAGGAALAAVLVCSLAAVAHGLRGAPARLLTDVGAVPVTRSAASPELVRLGNVVDALCLGLGVAAPTLAVIDEAAPNAVSVRVGGTRTLAVTSGLLVVPRDELEAVCAHELAHLHAVDARWVSAAESSLFLARRAALALVVVGFALVGLTQQIVVAGWSAGTGVTGIALGLTLAALGGLGAARLGRALGGIRTGADALADVAAVVLARNPAALGAVCAHLADDVRPVLRTSARAATAWFKLVPAPTTATVPSTTLTPEVRTRLEAVMEGPRRVANAGPAAELRARAAAAAHAAGPGAGSLHPTSEVAP